MREAQKDKKKKRQKDKDQTESLILWCQGSFALLQCFSLDLGWLCSYLLPTQKNLPQTKYSVWTPSIFLSDQLKTNIYLTPSTNKSQKTNPKMKTMKTNICLVPINTFLQQTTELDMKKYAEDKYSVPPTNPGFDCVCVWHSSLLELISNLPPSPPTHLNFDSPIWISAMLSCSNPSRRKLI